MYTYSSIVLNHQLQKQVVIIKKNLLIKCKE
jgi:hypothetical protein